MKRIHLFVFALILLLPAGTAFPADAQTGIRMLRDRATLQFPESITFSAQIQSGTSITSVVLEYGVLQLTCGSVLAKAFPQFTSSTDVQVSWTWDMRQSGSLPPGAGLWWRWQVTDSAGAQYTSPQQTVTWLDSRHSWQTLTGGDVNLHWYTGGISFGRALHDYAAQALTRLARDVGLGTGQPIDVYIYANTDDLKEAVLYEPSWIGGQAYPANDIVILGIAPADLEWGKRSEAHEMTHVLVGHLTFTCLGFIPTWLNEGLAVYGEGDLEDYDRAQFQRAIEGDTLLPLRSLGGGFSEESDRANLSYTQSYSVVNFLIQQYGREKMTALLLALRDGDTADQALQKVHGFDVDGLEDAWRASIGAPSRTGGAKPTSVPTPTVVPTIVPVSSAPLAAIPPVLNPTGVPAAATQPPSPAATAPPLPGRFRLGGTALILIGIGLAGLLVAAAILALAIVSARRRNGREK